MSISIFDLFSIGIGPSSSHTVGPMRAAHAFVQGFDKPSNVARIKAELFGSLALTGKGHGTDIAVLNGLEGKLPHTVIPECAVPRAKSICTEKKMLLNGEVPIDFNPETDLIFHYTESLPLHANGMRFTAYDKTGTTLFSDVYYSLGGGFITDEAHFNQTETDLSVPYPFDTAGELFAHCHQSGLSISEIMMANEHAMTPEKDIRAGIQGIARIMLTCIDKGCEHTGILPGGLNVKRRAPELFNKLSQQPDEQRRSPTGAMTWLNVYAMAVNEENAAGGRVVTAPTNGAAGIIPAVMKYYLEFCPGANEKGMVDFLLTAAAIAILYKKGASISAAEVGCQGEVGVACSMAAGALTAVLGGTLAQIENAAEIGMEHHLGLTCDPIGGLVQIPCIERNAVGAVQAVNITHLALMEEGTHRKVSLDDVIATMLQTGKDMKNTYKETALGGLAVNVSPDGIPIKVKVNLPEC